MITETDKKYLLESWKRYVQTVDKVRPMDQAGQIHFAKVLENTKQALRNRGIRNEGLVRNGILLEFPFIMTTYIMRW